MTCWVAHWRIGLPPPVRPKRSMQTKTSPNLSFALVWTFYNLHPVMGMWFIRSYLALSLYLSLSLFSLWCPENMLTNELRDNQYFGICDLLLHSLLSHSHHIMGYMGYFCCRVAGPQMTRGLAPPQSLKNQQNRLLRRSQSEGRIILTTSQYETNLGGGFKYLLFSSLLGEIIQFD